MNKGITLVALVITIIILVLLAGISISALTNQGLFDKVSSAKNITKEKADEENEILQNYLEQINAISEGKVVNSSAQNKVEVTEATTHTETALTYTWNEIAEIAKLISNNVSITNDTLAVKVTLNGETKTLGVGDTTTVDGKKVRILGFNHDTLTNSTAYGTATATGKAGISFEFVNFIDIDGNGTTRMAMNSDGNNLGGWGACELRSTLNSTTYNSLSIKDKIKRVNKEFIQTYNNANSKTTSSDYLWLLSCGEIWDNGVNGGITRGLAIATEGNQYKYYKDKLASAVYNSNSDITKKININSSTWWWLRSPTLSTKYNFCDVLDSGGSSAAHALDTNGGVAPGFDI